MTEAAKSNLETLEDELKGYEVINYDKLKEQKGD
jgi:hypothetical protein